MQKFSHFVFTLLSKFQKKVGDFFKFFGLLKITELYTKAFQVKSRVLKGTGHFMLRQSYFALVWLKQNEPFIFMLLHTAVSK